MYQSLIKPFAKDVYHFILDTLFPITCAACGKETSSDQSGNKDAGTGLICSDCKNGLSLLENQICIICSKPSPVGLTHPKCQSPHSADGLISFYNYHDEKVAGILIKGKYSFLPGVYEELGLILAQKIKNDYPELLNPENTILIPIPLHKWRHRWRGFNQSEILTQALASALSLPFYASVLVRCKPTRTQKNLKKDQRLKNVESAFEISPSPSLTDDGKNLPPKDSIADKNCILVDDVTTTGATLAEAAKVLKRNGASKVFCLTVARD